MPARPSAREPQHILTSLQEPILFQQAHAPSPALIAPPGHTGLRMRGSLVEVKASLDSLACRLEDLATREHALRAQEVARSGTNEGMSLPKNATC
jgi:hypothetical protein